VNFKFQPPAMFIKSYLSFEDPSAYKISRPDVDWSRFCIDLRSLKVRCFGIIEATGLKLMSGGHLQWHDLHTEFHKNLPNGSSVVSGDKNTQTEGNIINLLFSFRKESRLKCNGKRVRNSLCCSHNRWPLLRRSSLDPIA
jgi:hypothetical protein